MRLLKKKGKKKQSPAGVGVNVELYMSPFQLNALIFSPNPHFVNRYLLFFFFTCQPTKWLSYQLVFSLGRFILFSQKSTVGLRP